jgi:hypothetical protein
MFKNLASKVGLLNKTSCLAVALGVIKHITFIVMFSVTLVIFFPLVTLAILATLATLPHLTHLTHLSHLSHLSHYFVLLKSNFNVQQSSF